MLMSNAMDVTRVSCRSIGRSCVCVCNVCIVLCTPLPLVLIVCVCVT